MSMFPGTSRGLCNVSDETLLRLRERILRDPSFGKQLRVGPAQGLGMLNFLSGIERQALSQYGRGLYDALCEAGIVPDRMVRRADGRRPVTHVERQALRKLMAIMYEEPDFARAMRVGPIQMLGSHQRLSPEDRSILRALGRENINVVVEAWHFEGNASRAIAHLHDPLPQLGAGVQWFQADEQSILVDEHVEGGAWHAGCVRDVLVTAAGMVVAATDTGGLWIVDVDGGATPLSHDWFTNGFCCLAFGPDAPALDQIFAGGDSLWVSNVHGRGLDDWLEIGNLDANRASMGSIQSIAIDKIGRRIVLATTHGVYWSPIPTSPPYSFQRAVTPNVPYTGVAIGGGASPTVVAVGFGGLHRGTWSGTALTLTSPTIGVDGGSPEIFDQRTMNFTKIATSAGNPQWMYALSSGGGSVGGAVLAILRSHNGGQDWVAITDPTIEGTGTYLRDVAGYESGAYARPTNAIAVSPSDPNILAIGWQNGPYISEDGGSTWAAPIDTPHLHADFHGMFFRPSISTAREHLYVATDGGVMMTPDRGASWTSKFNQRLLNLQAAQVSGGNNSLHRGNLSVHPARFGVVATGLQDNGVVVYLPGYRNYWIRPFAGDGQYTLIVQHEAPPRIDNLIGCSFIEDARRTTSPQAIAGPTFGGPEIEIPLHTRAGEHMVPRVLEPVVPPRLWSGHSEPMLALGGGGVYSDGTDPNLPWWTGTYLTVFGLFEDSSQLGIHWEILGVVEPSNQELTALAPKSGGSVILAGTSTGRMYALAPGIGVADEVPVDLTTKESVKRIIVTDSEAAFALYARSPLRIVGESLTFDDVVLKLVARNGAPLWVLADGAGLPPGEPLIAISSFASKLFVATSASVFMSENDGATFTEIAMNLPRNARCTDLRVQRQHYRRGLATLYLSTYGHSLWAATVQT